VKAIKTRKLSCLNEIWKKKQECRLLLNYFENLSGDSNEIIADQKNGKYKMEVNNILETQI
jgi:predicted  nucleic acid-binding Zn-ribbon protein